MPPEPNLGGSMDSKARLERLGGLVRRWNSRINLVARSTVADLEARHIGDSAALWPLVPVDATCLVDLGSGGGFPGLVLAILAMGERPALRIHLVEADSRKVAFLQTAERELGLKNLTIHNLRIEDLGPLGADVVTARALAPLERLLDLAAPQLAAGGRCLFPKGRTWQDEVVAARSKWHFHPEVHPAASGGDGVILELTELARV